MNKNQIFFFEKNFNPIWIKKIYYFIILFCMINNCKALPSGFVYLKDIAPTIIQDMRYFSANNFVGRPIKGYEQSTCILTRQTAFALAQIQEKLKPLSLGLKVFDCYRPQSAVNDFIIWSRNLSDQKMKAQYYPTVNKSDVFRLGYVAMRSGHTRGSTVDLTIIYLKTKIELNMGTHFDYFDINSHPLVTNIKPELIKNRLLLRHMMLRNGFTPLSTEWWHFTLQNEPFPDTYFDFAVA